MRRTLSLLYEEGLAYRLPYFDLEQEVRTHVYGLSDKGVEWALENGCAGHGCKTFDEHSERTLDHELGISWFHIALKAFCERNNLHLYWQQRDLKCSINPDALFAITDPAKPDGQDTLYYFLEMERAKIGNFRNGESSIVRKLGNYYKYYNSDVCETEWETFRQFRVVIVQRTEARRQYLLRELEAIHRHRMFWLSTEQLYKQDIGAAIFLTPRDHETETYSFLAQWHKESSFPRA